MDEYANIYYVDPRNADGRDHRMGTSTGGAPPVAYGRGVPATRTVYAQPAPMVSTPMIYQAAPQPLASTLLGKLTTGQVVEMVAQIFAALQPLPGAPVATKDVGTDVGNLMLYQGALAQHAKRDEQVRTLGGLVARLVG
jgi:hypothetical protein